MWRALFLIVAVISCALIFVQCPLVHLLHKPNTYRHLSIDVTTGYYIYYVSFDCLGQET